MGKIIDADKLEKHHVKKFNFAALSVQEKKKTFDTNTFSTDNADTPKQDEIEEESQTEEQPSSKPDELLQKIETLSSENVTLQMELETLQKEFDEKLASQSEEAYKKGKEEGIKETQETLQEHNDELNMQLVKSVTTLDEQVHKHETFLKEVEEELIGACTIIAKRVIKKELSENSQEVAKTLAENFLGTLKEASAITLKVNPQDAHCLQEHFKMQKSIMIEADDAISKGGIIILSDIGNIDGTIKTRIEKAMALIEQEG